MAAIEALPLNLAKAHLRQMPDETAFDTLITGYIADAGAWVAGHCGLSPDSLAADSDDRIVSAMRIHLWWSFYGDTEFPLLALTGTLSGLRKVVSSEGESS